MSKNDILITPGCPHKRSAGSFARHDLPQRDDHQSVTTYVIPKTAVPKSEKTEKPEDATRVADLISREIRMFEVFPQLPSESEVVSLQWNYVLQAVRKPNPGSDFDLKTRWFRNWMPDNLLLFIIYMMGYNGYLMYRGHQIIGHMFYQKRGAFWYSFSLCIREDYRGKGLSRLLMSTILEHAYHSKKISGIRMGKGTHPIVERIRHKIVMNKTSLSFLVHPSKEPGWVMFVRK